MLSFYGIVSFLAALSMEIGSGDKESIKFFRDPTYNCFSSDKRAEETAEKAFFFTIYCLGKEDGECKLEIPIQKITFLSFVI